jgi:predicted DCC family thiol-disulfide oxidoreductase YuxK
VSEPSDLGDAVIVYFDGVCGLCNKSVDILISADRRGVLKFAPLQGETARQRLGVQPLVPEGVVLEDRGRIFHGSSAALRAAIALGGIYRLFAVLLLVPSPLRDLVYRFIARNRYSWFGKKDSCRLPTPQERPRFLP